MDEITDPEITVEVEGLKKDGPKSYIFSKRKDTLSYYQSTKFNTVSLLSCKNNIIFTQTKFSYGYFNQRIFHTRVRAASRIGPHNIDVISVLIGTLLGDAYANKRSIEGTRICYRQSIKHKDYLFWLPQSKSYSTLVKPVYPSIDPSYITGFVDGEGSFKISIYKKKECKTGWWISPSFVLEVHEKDANILYQIKSYFDVGSISIRKSNGQVIYTVASVKDLEQKIIPHFVKYPLLTKKWGDFILFCSAVNLIIQKKHLSLEGIEEIISIRASLNLGLTDTLKENFPNIKPINKPIRTENIAIYSPYWFAGFTEAEGCFWVSVNKSNSYKIGYQTQLLFTVAQHSRDEKLIESFVKYLECGKIQKGYNDASVNFIVTKFKDLDNKILPFFLKYNLLCSKNKEFTDFCNIHSLVKSKAHLTEKGLNKILEIKSGMNRGRKFSKENEISGGEKPLLSSPEEKISLLGETLNSNRINVGSFNVKNGIQKREFHTRVRASLRIGPHNKDVIAVLIGCLLGNSIVNPKRIEGTRIVIRLNSNMEYVQYLYNFFNTRGYCSNLEPRMYKRVLKKGEESTIHYGYEFNTYTFRSFNWIHEIFYKKGKKYINPKIENYITPLALAILIMDDGGYAKPGVRIATNSFNLEEVELLVKILKNKFDLDITVQHLKSINKYYIYIKGGSIPTLRNIVLPYFHPSMYYKLGL